MRKLSGFSLVEVMIALVIAMLLTAALVTAFVNANTTYGELTNMSRQIENGRYAMSLLEAEVQHAGFYGEYTGKLAERDPLSPPVIAAPQPCTDEPAQFLTSLMVPVYGYEGAGAAPLPCLENYRPGTDVLVIRRTSTQATLPASLLAGTIYFQGFLDSPPASAGNAPVLDYGAIGAAAFGVKFEPTSAAVPIRAFIERIFYIADCSRCDGTDTTPTLYQKHYLGHGAFANAPLVEGIENMRIRYGVDKSGLNNGSPSIYMRPSVMAMDPDWDSVVSVEINLLARNTKESRDYKDTKTYTLGPDVVGPFNDGVRRHVFTQVVRAVNVAARREE